MPCALAWAASGGLAQADEGRLRLMQETIPFTDVIDAADGDDPFDISAHVGFVRSVEHGKIRRQQGAGSVAVADSEAKRSELMFGLDVGLYKDLMATFRMPLIINDERALRVPSGKDAASVQDDISDPVGDGGGDAPLFDLATPGGAPSTLRSPTRAGLDYIGIGLAWGVINQMRDPTMPTLVFLIEGRIAVGQIMRPCLDTKDGIVCGNDGVGDYGNEPGSSRGINGFRFETRTSHRYRYVEPYGGIGVLVQWPSKRADPMFYPVGGVDSYIHKLPSQVVKTQIGAVFIPWENRARFQRVGIDVQVHGTYFSEGHDYTALFDALGTSSHPHLATPLPEGNVDENPGLRSGGFTGLTDVQGHFRYGLKLAVEVRAAEYVRFVLGSRLNWVTDYALTSADPCNPNPRIDVDDARAGSCAAGVINPHHRAVIDLPGRRFLMTDLFAYDIHFAATATF